MQLVEYRDQIKHIHEELGKSIIVKYPRILSIARNALERISNRDKATFESNIAEAALERLNKAVGELENTPIVRKVATIIVPREVFELALNHASYKAVEKDCPSCIVVPQTVWMRLDDLGITLETERVLYDLCRALQGIDWLILELL